MNNEIGMSSPSHHRTRPPDLLAGVCRLVRMVGFPQLVLGAWQFV